MNGGYLSVSQLTGYIKSLLEADDVLGAVSVSGEISNITYHSSGHLYLTLKDENSTLAAVMFRMDASRLTFRPENGMRVIASGRVSVYERNGQYQLYIAHMRPDGIGQLYMELELLKKKLAAEGLFDPARKKKLPVYPKRIGVVTSSTGAVIKITHSKGVTHAKTQEWNNGKNGLLLSDAYLGSYVGNGEQLTIDGFGKATYGTSAGTYVINGTNKITVYIDDVPCAYQLNVETGEYTVMDIKFDNSLIEGKTYFADYNFICNNYLYSATTTFAFLANGKVKITSKSTEHDSGEDRCTMDSYSPVFCPDGSIVGTYSVVGTKITVTANGYTITFNILNAVYPNEISCLSTTVSSEAHGYFKETTVFSREGA